MTCSGATRGSPKAAKSGSGPCPTRTAPTACAPGRSRPRSPRCLQHHRLLAHDAAGEPRGRLAVEQPAQLRKVDLLLLTDVLVEHAVERAQGDRPARVILGHLLERMQVDL